MGLEVEEEVVLVEDEVVTDGIKVRVGPRSILFLLSDLVFD